MMCGSSDLTLTGVVNLTSCVTVTSVVTLTSDVTLATVRDCDECGDWDKKVM